jgi:ribosomal protein L6P/L9E
MSRIGNKPVPVPAGVTVEINDGEVVVKGKGGELRQPYKHDDPRGGWHDFGGASL